MKKGFYCLYEPNKTKEVIPKRSDKKGLPQICHKEVPLHNNSYEKDYRHPINKGLSLERWAYIPNPRKKDLAMTKYIHLFDQFRTHPTIHLNPEAEDSSPNNNQSQTIMASLTLLDQYFKRKKSSRLKQIVKIPYNEEQEEINSTVGGEKQAKSLRSRQTIQHFSRFRKEKSKEEQSSFKTPDNREKRFRMTQRKQRSRTNNMVDYYFGDKKMIG